MQKFKSLEAFELKVPEIDGEHRTMLALMKAVQAAAAAGNRNRCERCLDRLIAFSRIHFRHEEEFIAHHGYPSVKQHAAYHNDLLERAEAMRTACLAAETAQAYLDCCQELISFLIDDVVRGDMGLKSLFEEAGLTVPVQGDRD